MTEAERILKATNHSLDVLYDLAKKEVDRYWQFRIAENRKRPSKEKSHLGVRARVVDGTIVIEWTVYDFRVIAGKQVPFRKGLRKGKGMSYSAAMLARHAQPWEIERLLESEKVFALLRAMTTHVHRARRACRDLGKVETKWAEDTGATLQEAIAAAN